MNYLPLVEQKKMMGELVSAVGTCGIGDGEIVKGLLVELSPIPIVYVPKGKGRMQPYEVNGQTLKLLTEDEKKVYLKICYF